MADSEEAIILKPAIPRNRSKVKSRDDAKWLELPLLNPKLDPFGLDRKFLFRVEDSTAHFWCQRAVFL